MLQVESSGKQMPSQIYWRITPAEKKKKRTGGGGGERQDWAGVAIKLQCRSSEGCASPMGSCRAKIAVERDPELGRSEDSLYRT